MIRSAHSILLVPLVAVGLLPACGDSTGPDPCACRGDEICESGECVHWTDTPLVADFELSLIDGREIRCALDESGFPHQRVQSIRYSFGDGEVAYGGEVSHRYDTPGLYAVDLEVRLEGFRVLRASRLAAVAGDGESLAPRLGLTVSEIPPFLNGSQSFTSDANTPNDPADDVVEEFHLLLPAHGFTIDVEIFDTPNARLAPGDVRLTADVALGDGRDAGADLSDRLVFVDSAQQRVPRAQWLVAPSEAFPVGPVTIRLSATDSLGTVHEHDLSFEVAELDASRDPLDRPAGWLFRFEQDLFTTSASDEVGIVSSPGADGVPDFAAELRTVGAQGDETASGAADVEGRNRVGANAIYQRWIIEEIVTEVYRYYLMAPDGSPRDMISLPIWVDGDPAAPAPSTFAADGDFSMMRFGGSLSGAFGASNVSPYNQERIDDTSSGLGVATGPILGGLSITANLWDQFYEIRPGYGTPVGDHPSDPVVLSDDFDRNALDNDPIHNERYDHLARIARLVGISIAAVTAHEMGHAMGLMPNGAPPAGFFGNRGDVEFIGAERTNPFHVDFEFVNLMEAGGSPLVVLEAALDYIDVPKGYSLTDLVLMLGAENRLSPYARAYFRRQLTYSNGDTAVRTLRE